MDCRDVYRNCVSAGAPDEFPETVNALPLTHTAVLGRALSSLALSPVQLPTFADSELWARHRSRFPEPHISND